MKKEVRVNWGDVQDPEKITDHNIRLFKERGMDIKMNEADLEDDPDRQERILRLKTSTKYFYRK